MIHDQYMEYAIKIAKRGKTKASPNPMVGSVIVYRDRILAEGYHIEFGQDHAERMAVRMIRSEDRHLLSESTLYVTLEPCNHTGKTPPCSDLIIQSGIKKLVYGCMDPNPLMSGKSIDFLKQKGISIEGPILEDQCKNLIENFSINILLNRPYVILKWAQSSDYYMGIENQRVKVSNFQSDILVHKWRSEVDGICTSHMTWKTDHPLLTVRHWVGKNPKKFVLSSNDKHLIEIQNNDKEFIPFLFSSESDLVMSLQNIYEAHRIGILFIEAGPTMLKKFIDMDLWDEARIITNQELKLHNGLKSPIIKGKIVSKSCISSDQITIIKNESSLNR